MVQELKIAYESRIAQAKEDFHRGALDLAFKKLEEAHILGQRYVIPHTTSHIWMLRIAFRRKDFKEILGQLIRIPGGVIGSLFGVIPTGNTGGANISAFKQLPIPKNLEVFLELDRDKLD